MSKALAWIQKSKGDNSDIGLEEQRELVRTLANGIADEVKILNLGIHTGFLYDDSRRSRGTPRSERERCETRQRATGWRVLTFDRVG